MSAGCAPALMLFLLLIVAPGVQACLWDDDTLTAEAKGLPDVVGVISGRFERNPPLYYEMRLARVSAIIARNPRVLEAYDNAGVACDRLGRGDEAIEWMKRKRAQLDRMPESEPGRRKHQYRYLANLGTFLAHRWFRSGANGDNTKDLREAVRLLRAAIRLNPKAHFGREKYQLCALEWILKWPAAPETAEDVQSLPNFLASDTGLLKKHEYPDAVRGLSGLITLGNAWESIDVYWALKYALKLEGHSSLAYLARLRCLELADQGRVSLAPGKREGPGLIARIKEDAYFGLRETKSLDEFYTRSRDEAEEWHNRRWRFMMARLEAGRHPDTDPDFWSGYRAGSPPPLPGNHLYEQTWLLYVAFGITVILAAVFWDLSFQHRRLASR